ncbi:MAG: HEAT repeat domain-containing protein [Candidatus Aminicenantales bacterium]
MAVILLALAIVAVPGRGSQFEPGEAFFSALNNTKFLCLNMEQKFVLEMHEIQGEPIDMDCLRRIFQYAGFQVGESPCPAGSVVLNVYIQWEALGGTYAKSTMPGLTPGQVLKLYVGAIVGGTFNFVLGDKELYASDYRFHDEIRVPREIQIPASDLLMFTQEHGHWSSAPFLEAFRKTGTIRSLADLAGQISFDKYWTGALKDEDIILRLDAAMMLASFRDRRAVDPLISFLKDQDKEVRREAVKTLGELKEGHALEPLVSSLKDTDRIVREYAAEALGKLGDSRAVMPLAAALNDPDYGERSYIANALAKLKDRRAVEPLAKLAASINWQEKTDDDFTLMFNRSMIDALVNFKMEKAYETIIPLLDDDKYKTWVISALGRLGDRRAVGSLLPLLDPKGSFSIFRLAMEALLKIQDGRVIGPLMDMLEKGKDTLDWAEKNEIFWALGEFKDSRGNATLIEYLKKFIESQNVPQVGGILALWKITRDRQYRDILISLLKHEKNGIRDDAVRALGETEEPSVLNHILAVLKDQNSTERAAAAEALGHFKTASSIEALISVLQDSDLNTNASISLGDISGLRLSRSRFWTYWWEKNKNSYK